MTIINVTVLFAKNGDHAGSGVEITRTIAYQNFNPALSPAPNLPIRARVSEEREKKRQSPKKFQRRRGLDHLSDRRTSRRYCVGNGNMRMVILVADHRAKMFFLN
jgi:hypothetical protein